MTAATFHLSADPVEAHKALAGSVWQKVKALAMAGHRTEVTVKPAKRSTDQNRKLHALLGQISGQIEWAGKRRDVETWKRLMVGAWLRARGESLEMLPALDGHGVEIVFRRTSELTRSECAELIEYVQAWAADNGVTLEHVDPATGEILRSRR